MASMSTDRPTTSHNDEAQPQALPQRTGRKPYVAPRLRHLGSVRDLTLGTSNKVGEVGRTMNM